MSHQTKAIEEFKNEIEKASWKMLKDHHQRGAVFVITHKLKIEEVANAFARDYQDIVKIWLDNKDLYKLSDEEAKQLESDSSEYRFSFLIVQPYVIVQYLV